MYVHADTCDPTWQSSRDGLVISAHVFSDISLLIFMAAGIYLLWTISVSNMNRHIIIMDTLMITWEVEWGIESLQHQSFTHYNSLVIYIT